MPCQKEWYNCSLSQVVLYFLSSFSRKILLSKLDKRKPDIDGLLRKADLVVDNNDDATEVRSAVTQISEPVVENVETIATRLKKKRQKLRRVLTKHGRIDDVMQNFSDQLKAIEKRQEQQRPLSAVFETVRSQRNNSEAIVDGIVDLSADFKELERKVHETVDREEQPKEKDRVIESFEKIKERFENVKEQGTRAVIKAKLVEAPARVHKDKAVEFVAWLDTAEKKLKDIERKDIDGEDLEDVIKKRNDTLKVRTMVEVWNIVISLF